MANSWDTGPSFFPLSPACRAQGNYARFILQEGREMPRKTFSSLAFPLPKKKTMLKGGPGTSTYPELFSSYLAQGLSQFDIVRVSFFSIKRV